MITLLTKPNIGALKSNNANNKPSIVIYMISEEVFVLFFYFLIYWSSRKNTMPFLSVAPTNNRTGQSPLRKNLESA